MVWPLPLPLLAPHFPLRILPSPNSFSAFVKAGAEGFLIGAVKDVTIDPAQLLHVVDVDGNGTLAWEPAHDEYGNISINQAGRRAKFKGMKHYEAYNVLCEVSC